MAEFKPKIRESGSAASIRTGITPGVTVSDGDFYVNAASGHLSVEAGGVQVPIASDVIVTCAVNVDTDVTATTAPIHRLAVITDGVASTPGDGLVRSVSGKTPNDSGAVSLTYTDVGAAAATHTHVMMGITDWETYFTRIGRSGTGTLSVTGTNWTINSTISSDGYDISTIYSDVTIYGLSSAMSASSTLFVDVNPASVTNARAYQQLIDDWQYVYRVDYQASNKVRVYSTKIPENAVPIKVTVMSYY